MTAYIDSNSEGSDSDMSDVAELDSDVEAEKQISYTRELDEKDMKLLKKQIKTELGAGEKRKQAPSNSLKLQFVHGYVRMWYEYRHLVLQKSCLSRRCSSWKYLKTR